MRVRIGDANLFGSTDCSDELVRKEHDDSSFDKSRFASLFTTLLIHSCLLRPCGLEDISVMPVNGHARMYLSFLSHAFENIQTEIFIRKNCSDPYGTNKHTHILLSLDAAFRIRSAIIDVSAPPPATFLKKKVSLGPTRTHHLSSLG